MFRALHVYNYRMYAAGSVVSNVGTWMQRVAQDWLVLELTDSGAAVGITTGLQFLPLLLFSPIAGVAADRFSKRHLLMVTQSWMGAIAIVLGTLALTGAVEVWHVFVLAFLFGTGTAFDAPTRQAFVNEMVARDGIMNAVALNSATFNLARMVGPAVAGGLIALFGSGVAATGAVIAINGASYAAVVVQLRRMRTEELHPAPPVGRGPGQIREGLRYLRSRKDIVLVLGVVFSAGTFGLNFQLTNALMATDAFHKGAGEFGVLGSVLAVGSFFGALMAARRSSSRQRLVILSALAFGASEVVLGLMPNYLSFAAFLPVCGFAGLTVATAANSFVQLASDPMMRGRVMAVYMMIFAGGKPLGSPLLGWVSDHFGPRTMLIGGGGLTIVGTVLSVVITTRGRISPTRYIRSAGRRETNDNSLSSPASPVS